MKMTNAKVAAGGCQDVVKFVKNESREFYLKLEELNSEQNKATYSAEKINQDRIQLGEEYKIAIAKRTADYKDAVLNLRAKYSEGKKSDISTDIAFGNVLQYINLSKMSTDSEIRNAERHINALMKPIYDSNDIEKFAIVWDLVPKISLHPKMYILHALDSEIQDCLDNLTKAAENILHLSESLTADTSAGSQPTANFMGTPTPESVTDGLTAYLDKIKEKLEELENIANDTLPKENLNPVQFDFGFRGVR